MDETTIAVITSSVISLLVPFLKKAGEKFSEEIGKQSADHVKHLYELIKKKFSSKKSTREILADFEQDPTSNELQTVFRFQLKKVLSDDKIFAKSIANFLKSENNSEGLVNIISDNGGIATQGGVAAGKGGVAINGDVHGNINIDN